VLLHSSSELIADILDILKQEVVVASQSGKYNFSLESRNADADLSAEQAGRLCYLSGHRPNPKTATNADYLLNIQNERHYSVLGHASASFYIEGITRNCTHEIIRHRWFTFSEVSQRFVNIHRLGVALHPGLSAWMDTNLENDDGRQDMLMTIDRLTKDAYGIIVDELINNHHYSTKKARQAARHVLVGGTETKMLMSGNLRAWRDFLAQRLSPHADDEIRAVALEIFRILKHEFPNSFQDFDSHGLITVERLVARAVDRYETADALASYPRREMTEALVAEIKRILKEGLWVLKTDPWVDEYVIEEKADGGQRHTHSLSSS